MFIEKSINSFIEEPSDTLKACHDGPVELTGNDQSYVLMTKGFLNRLLSDISLANNLDKILARMKRDKNVPEKKVMELLDFK
jgi:hypothetical protein